MDQNTQGTRKLISEGILLGALPVLGYALAYTYEFGYLQHFGVPVDMIVVDLPRILLATGSAIGVLGVLYLFCDIVYTALPPLPCDDPVVRCVVRSLPFVIVFVVVWITYGNRWTYLGWVGLFVVVNLLHEFGLPLLTRRSTKGYRAKLIAQEEFVRRIPSINKVIITRTDPNNWPRLLVVLGFVVLMFLAALTSGHAYAIKRKTYPVRPSQTDYAIIRVYGDTIISAKYDPRSRELLGETVVEVISPDRSLTFVHKEIGPLKRAHQP